jgi:hypothetical protein
MLLPGPLLDPASPLDPFFDDPPFADFDLACFAEPLSDESSPPEDLPTALACFPVESFEDFSLPVVSIGPSCFSLL